MKVELNNIGFSYDQGRKTLNNITFSLERGNTLSIVGASGCGKSTLLRIISGILPSNKNKNILTGNVRVDDKTADEYRKSGKLAFMFQEATLIPNLTVSNNIGMPLNFNGKKDAARVCTLLKLVGLSEYSDYLPKQLSGGMKTRVALARSFVTEPELLLLDEPFSALDIAWKSKLYIELEKLREKFNTTIIFVTHDVQEALLLSNNVIVLNTLGEIEAAYTINTEKSIHNRVNDISGFMSEVYTDYMLPIQEAIINGKNKKSEKVDIILTN